MSSIVPRSSNDGVNDIHDTPEQRSTGTPNHNDAISRAFANLGGQFGHNPALTHSRNRPDGRDPNAEDIAHNVMNEQQD